MDSARARPGKGVIYTLEQSAVKASPKEARIISGNGSDATDKRLTENRGKRKLISGVMNLKLAIYATSIGDFESAKKYRSSYYCQSKIVHKDGRTYADYCGHRLCALCMANRKCELMRKYLPVLEKWKDPYFVTLTVQAVPFGKLKARVHNLFRAFEIVKNKIRDKHRRGKCAKFIGIRSIECNFNPKARTYNPHIHLIIEGREMAELLKDEWLKLWTEKYVYAGAQHIRKIKTKRIKDMIETIKYSAKIFTAIDSKNKRNVKIFIAAMHEIDKAFRRRRLFASFGFNLPKEAQKKPTGARLIVDFETFKFDLKKANWYNEETAEVLAQYYPELELLLNLEYRIDSERK